MTMDMLLKGLRGEEKEKEKSTEEKSDMKMPKPPKKNKPPLTFKDFGIGKLLVVGVCIGVLLLLSFPGVFGGGEKKEENVGTITGSSKKSESIDNYQEYTDKLENRLKQILSEVSNIGKTEVMITLKSSKELVTLKDQPYEKESTTEKDSAGGTRDSESTKQQESTVYSTNGSGNSSPYVIKELEPEIEGVLVIAEGGDNKAVVSDIIESVSVLFDVPIHKIKVMNMK